MTTLNEIKHFLVCAPGRFAAALNVFRGAKVSGGKGVEANGSTKEGLYLRQRNEARQQRDEARLQRDEARKQRDKIKADFASDHSLVKDFKVLGEINSAVRAADSKLQNLHRKLEGVVFSALVARFSVPQRPAHYKNEIHRARLLDEIKTRDEIDGTKLSTTERELLSARKVPLFERRISKRHAPSAQVAFVTVANDRFFPGVEGLLLSLLDVYPELTSNIFIYHDGSLTSFAQSKLLEIYPRCLFVVPDMDWLDLGEGKSDNQRRIGKLGYMNLNALLHDNYEHVVVLDSDLLILDDISACWAAKDEISVAYDCGDREYAAFSGASSDYIYNSGVIGIPNKFLGSEKFEDIKALAIESLFGTDCSLLDRFADQRVWNLYLADKPRKALPINYNCNVKYIVKHMNGRSEGVSVIHFAGPKPWISRDYLPESLLPEARPSKSTTYHDLWETRFRSLKYRRRSIQFESYWLERGRNARIRTNSVSVDGKQACLLIGNGPSIDNTDFSRVGRFEKFCFNWFILHNRFDEIRPDHLILASHMFFGGWNTLSPSFPDGYLERLRELEHKPVIWTSFYFKPYFESLKLNTQFDVRYFLFEKPFKSFIDQVGSTPSDLRNFLDDGRTGVLTSGVPIAVDLGYDRLVLVGCDSDYQQNATGENYFYPTELHTSESTRTSSLASTWEAGGSGHFSYSVVRRCLEERGVELLDATVGGALTTVPKISIEQIETGEIADST